MKITRQILVCFSHFHLLLSRTLSVHTQHMDEAASGTVVDLLMMENLKNLLHSPTENVLNLFLCVHRLQWLRWVKMIQQFEKSKKFIS